MSEGRNMKIYDKIVIDMSSGKVLSEISSEYSGKIAKCKGGGGGSGGSSGKVDYPTYMKDQHLTWLTDVATDITNARTGNSPYYAAAPYDPGTNITAMGTAVSTFNTLVDALSHEADWVAAVAQAETTIRILRSRYFGAVAL